MKPFVLALSFLLAVSFLLMPAAWLGAREPTTTELTADEVARMEKGGVVVKTETQPGEDGKLAARIKAYCIINRPPAAAWAIMLDYQRFHEFMPRLERVQILQKTKDTMKVTQTVRIPLGLLSYTLDLKFERALGKVSWALDRSRKHDIADTFGAWEFLPYGNNKTSLRYTTTLDSGMLIPKYLEDLLIKNDLPEILLSMRRRTESDGTWKKELEAAGGDLRPVEPAGRAGQSGQ
jgi:carbon monoxide dehydrogenase subunit G